MRNKKYTVVTIAMAICLLGANRAITNFSGAPAGRTGSPTSNGASCSAATCHSGPAVSTESINIQTTIPSTGFVEDTTYEISITGDDGGRGLTRIGFSASVEHNGSHQGDIIVTSMAKTRKIGDYITHTTVGADDASGGQNTFSFDWDSQQAPDQTTVYAAVNFTNANGTSSGDVIATEDLVLSKDNSMGLAESRRVRFNVFPNPAVDYIMLASNQNLQAPLRIFDASGKERVLVEDLHKHDGQHWKINVQSLTPGNYIIRTGGGGVARFVKE